MADQQHRIVIARRRPWWRWVVIGLISALLVLAAAWTLYYYTRATTISEFQSARTERDHLRSNNGTLSERLRAAHDENRDLRDQLAYIKRSGQINGGACTLVKSSLVSMQQENSTLREQLAFYRGIVSPKQSSEGLRVYDLKMTRNSHGAGQYDFELLLIQPMRHDHSVNGNAQVVINGLQDGQRHSYALADLITAGDKNLLFSFKYFQELDGRFRLPKGFRPIRVTVTLKPGDDLAKVEEAYDWAKIEQAAEVK